MFNPTPDLVRSFWTYMQEAYRSKVISKEDSELMKLVAEFLDRLKIMDKVTFLQCFTTTIPLTRKIYIPFEIGVENEYYSLWGQLRVCVHEHTHIEQQDREGDIFDLRYVTSSPFRAGYEAEALGSDLEMEYWRDPKTDLDWLAAQRASILIGYACSALDIEQAKEMLYLRIPVIRAGGVSNRASQFAIAWLDSLPQT